jgi:ferredoxin-like protein FixX
MAFRRHHLHDGVATKVPVQVLRHHNWHREILGALNNVAWDTNVREEAAHIALEDRLGNIKCNVRTYIEECPAKLLNCH